MSVLIFGRSNWDKRTVTEILYNYLIAFCIAIINIDTATLMRKTHCPRKTWRYICKNVLLVLNNLLSTFTLKIYFGYTPNSREVKDAEYMHINHVITKWNVGRFRGN